MFTTKEKNILFSLVILLVVICFNIPDATAICWSMLKTKDEHGSTNEGPFIMRGKLIDEGGGYYSLHAFIEAPDDPLPISGSGVIVKTKILVTASISQDHTRAGSPWRDSGIIQMRFDKSTFNGTWWSTRLDFNTSEHTFDLGYAAGTMKRITCP
jgi:hypothetical protein